jgi:hypothetical protein
MSESEIDPIAERISQTHENTIHDNMLSSVLGGGAFRLPYGDRNTELTNAHTQYDASNGELNHSIGRDLKQLADDAQNSSNKDSFATTNPLRD